MSKEEKKEGLTTKPGLVESRVRPSIRELKAYSVPHIDCSVKLDGNESPFDLSGELSVKVEEALRNVEVNRYPDPESSELRELISQTSGISKEGILLGNGSDELIGILITTFSSGTGRVLYPTPTFSMYGITGAAMGMELFEVPLDARFDIDLGPTLESIKQNDPDLIFLASPNNPTGNIYSSSKIEEILKRSKGIVVVDEAYSDFSGYTFMPLMSEYPNLVILRTLSKVGYAALRLGIIYAGEELASELNKVRYPYNINSLSQAAAEVVLRNHASSNENIQLIVRERGRVLSALRQMDKIKPFESQANFILFNTDDADTVFKGLVERDVLIRNFNRPGRLENCMRVTIGTPEENNAFLNALLDILQS